MTVNHPKIIALKLELEKNRQHIDVKPRGSMEISLPIPVKIDPNTVNYKLAKGTDGVIVLMADFCTSKDNAQQSNMNLNVILKISRAYNHFFLHPPG